MFPSCRSVPANLERVYQTEVGLEAGAPSPYAMFVWIIHIEIAMIWRSFPNQCEDLLIFLR